MTNSLSQHHRFRAIQDWVFDLDNTIYPAECNLFHQIDIRMARFIANYLDINLEQARSLQKKYFKEHGTTLNGLMTVHKLEPSRFLDFVHDIDHSPVVYNDSLKQAMTRLKGRKFIFTNGTIAHAEKVLNRLDLTNHFEDIFDITTTNYIPKPQAAAYDVLVHKLQAHPEKAVFFEDLACNLEVPHQLGMTTVFVKSKGEHPDAKLGLTGTGLEPHIDYVTDDLAAFLHLITNEREHNQT